MTHVFVSYVRENQGVVDRLCGDLTSAGIDLWLDREQLTPGQRWQQTIREAIEAGSFFIACFSPEYSEKSRSYMNEELALAIEELRRRPADRTWFIPVLLSECAVPDRPIGGGETLRDIQWVSLEPDWREGVRKIIRAIRGAASEPHMRRWIVMMMTDIVGSRLLARLGPEPIRETLLDLSSIQAACIRERGGHFVEDLGDSLLSTFNTATAAVQCAIQIQQVVAEYASREGRSDVALRIGLHAGEALVSDHGALGATVNVTARICSRAIPGQILISNAVKDALEGDRFVFDQRETAMLRGFQQPFEIFAVSPRHVA